MIRPHYVDQASLALCLPLPPEYSDKGLKVDTPGVAAHLTSVVKPETMVLTERKNKTHEQKT